MLNTSLSLRPYQETMIRAVFEHWQKVPRVLLQSPTGSGKTVIFSAIADNFIRRGERVLVLVHRQELLGQAKAKIEAIANCEVGIIQGSTRPNYDAVVQVASVQSLVNRLHLLEQPGLIIIDECHHAPANSYRTILNAYEGAYTLGVSATPCRTTGEGFDDIFDALIPGPKVSDLIKDGYLSPFRLFADPKPMTTKGVKKQQGDYSASDLAAANDAIELSGNLISSYRIHCPGKRCVVFAVNVEHSRTIAARYNQAGIPAKHLDGNTPDDERREALRQFAAGELLVLTNCALFDEGLDIPAIEAIQCAKPTASLVKWLQMVGRALRTAPGKEYAVILDHTKNWAVHGLPTRPRRWSLEGVETEQKQIRVNPEGEVIERDIPDEVAIAETDDTLTEVELSPLDEWRQLLDELIATQQARNYKPSWVWHQLLELKPPLEVWQRYASYRGYKPGWAYYQHKATQESKAA